MTEIKELFPGVYELNGRLATLNLTTGKTVYGERLIKYEGKEYRLWEPSRSKLGASILKGLRNLAISPGKKVLYLGAASGTTVSHCSDIVGKEGIIYAVEFSPQSMKQLLKLCSVRKNIVPILEDARFPERYSAYIMERVDCIFEDVADKEQDRIMIENSAQFLKKKGMSLLSVKARCVDSIRKPKEIYAEVIGALENHFRVIEKIDLSPFEEDHLFLVMEKK